MSSTRLLRIVACIVLLSSFARGEVITISADDIANIQTVLDKAQPGDVIRIPGGTHKLATTIKLHAKGTEHKPIRIEPADEKRPVLDFTGQEIVNANRGIEVIGDWWHITGIEITGAGDNGINITGHHNTIENCVVHDCHDTGIQIHQPASHTLVLNCDSFHNYDPPTHGENADGFAAKFNVGPGNVFQNCRAWENADDGWDLWKAPHPVRIENCVAFRNGLNLWKIEQFTGNGNGFKLGGAHIPAAHVVSRCVAVDQPKRGFDQNNNDGPLTIEDCTAIRCNFGFYLPAVPKDGSSHVLRRNLSLDSPVRIVEGSVQEENRWTKVTAPTTSPTSQPK